MRTMMATALVLALFAGVAPAARANDSSAELRTGGLVLTRRPDIDMRSEDLFVSARQVRVRYRFVNTSTRDVTVLVAFPMPDITIEGEDDVLSIPTQDPRNILGFTTTVDGKPVAAQVEQKALAGGVDRTAYLQANGLPLAPHLAATNAALDRLPAAKRDEIVRLGLGKIMEYDAGKGWERHLYATWTLKTTYYWSQVFPAGKQTVVEHRYRPSVGETAGTQWGTPYGRDDPELAQAQALGRKRYCIDDAFLASIERVKSATRQEYPPFTEQRIEYVLSTGANWKAPIGDFRLVVDKGDPSSLVSFCGVGVRKISPTRFELRRTNFSPTGDLSILILKRILPE